MNKKKFNTIFDDVFRTISEKMPFLMIPLINEVFHTDYPEDFSMESLRNEHQESSGKIITDSLFKIEDFLYHMECQSKKDGTMAIRMFQYDAAIAIEHATQTADDQTEAYFPKSCVLYIRNHREIQHQHTVNVHFADGQTVNCHCPIVYAQKYTIDSIFEKRLLLLLPYYILRYEHFLKSNTNDTDKIDQLLKDYTTICERLSQIMEYSEKRSLYLDLIKLINQVADYIIPADKPVKERMELVMDGNVLKLFSDELEEHEKRGIKKGTEEAHYTMSVKLHQHGMSISEIAEVVQESPTVVAEWLASSKIHA